MKSTTQKLKRTAAIVALLCLFVMVVNAQSQKEQHKKDVATKTAETGGKKGPLKQGLEPWEAWDKYRDQMIVISRQLGVTCNHCHDTRNYRDSSKATHKIAKAHMEMVDMINEKFKHSFSDKVDCYMCHKGIAKPEFKEKKDKF